MQNVKQKFENLPTQQKWKFGVLRGKMSMDVTPYDWDKIGI